MCPYMESGSVVMTPPPTPRHHHHLFAHPTFKLSIQQLTLTNARLSALTRKNVSGCVFTQQKTRKEAEENKHFPADFTVTDHKPLPVSRPPHNYPENGVIKVPF
ncbi:hypothetical protein BaRGS_00025779 [Batillaria attramentaria]|uniref:Uncharacterized protein n=1 Tax=Batillaria attramentaria TaxID=370345 RepID=A0ABD0K7P3_9CAEN